MRSRPTCELAYAGEGVVDPSLVHIVKTHWPERPGFSSYHAHRAVLLVRNPFDAIDSYFNMCLTNTHHLSLAESVRATPDARLN